MTELPMACTLTADQLTARRSDLLPGLMSRVVERREIASGFGYRFEASGDTLNSIVRVIDAERQCCQFFRFQLIIEPAEGPIWLEITGPDGTQEFLRGLV